VLRLLAGCAVAALTGGAGADLLAEDLRLPSGPYKYVIVDQDLREVLAEFGRNLNIAVRVSEEVQGRVRGPLPPLSADEFLARLCDTYAIVRFYDGGVLHVSAATELRTELLDLGGARPDDASRKLTEIGATDPRLHWSVATDAGMVSATGSPPYLARVKEMLTVLARARTRRAGEIVDDGRVRVFRGRP
jgi:type II secretory pathway component GspD/PulD (secretin)